MLSRGGTRGESIGWLSRLVLGVSLNYRFRKRDVATRPLELVPENALLPLHFERADLPSSL